MSIKRFADGTTYTKAHAHDWEDPSCTITGRCKIYIKVDGIRALRNKNGQVRSRADKPLPHLDHLNFQDAEIFRNSWNETSSILGSDAPPTTPLTQENVYELRDGFIDERLYIGWADNPSNENLHKLMLKYLELGHEGLIVRTVKKSGEIVWWKIVPYKYADVRIIGFTEGTGKNKGMLGALITTVCKIGTGFTEALRKELWHRRSTLKDKIVQVKYREKTATGKLRFPSYQCIRWDKTEESFD